MESTGRTCDGLFISKMVSTVRVGFWEDEAGNEKKKEHKDLVLRSPLWAMGDYF